MKIFYASSSLDSKIRADDILEYLQSGNEVFHYHHKFNEVNDLYSFDEIVGMILSSDVFIGEMSKPSQTLGFQLALALQASKPCLYLYDNISKGKPAGLIGNIPSRNLRIKSYADRNFRNVLDDFLEFAQRQMQTARTSFMSTKEIDEYLSRQSKKQGTPKGELIRQIIHSDIERSESSSK